MRNPFYIDTEEYRKYDEIITLANEYEEITGEQVFLGYCEPGFYEFVDGKLTTLDYAIAHMRTHLEDAQSNFV